MGQFDEALDDDITGFIINAPPGWGKTRTILAMIQRIAKNALVVVPTTDMVVQWVERIKEHTTIPDTDVAIFNRGKTNYNSGKKISIGLVKTLKLPRFHKYLKDFGRCCR